MGNLGTVALQSCCEGRVGGERRVCRRWNPGWISKLRCIRKNSHSRYLPSGETVGRTDLCRMLRTRDTDRKLYVPWIRRKSRCGAINMLEPDTAQGHLFTVTSSPKRHHATTVPWVVVLLCFVVGVIPPSTILLHRSRGRSGSWHWPGFAS